MSEQQTQQQQARQHDMQASKCGPGERTLAEIIADLSKPIPDRFLRTRQKGGATLTFFTRVAAKRFLDY